MACRPMNEFGLGPMLRAFLAEVSPLTSQKRYTYAENLFSSSVNSAADEGWRIAKGESDSSLRSNGISNTDTGIIICSFKPVWSNI